MSANNIFNNLEILLGIPDLASKKWVYQQYDSEVGNDTLSISSDAAIMRVHNSNKALALTSDCTPRYVEADPFLGACQAVVETYRNICAVGARPLAITNCLNFGNPQKPEIMGQIVRAIKGINAASIALNYPIVSGNVSLYNETDGKAIKPTPTIGGVGLLTDLKQRCDLAFKNIGDVVLLIGENKAYVGASLFEREILEIKNQKNPPPPVDLALEKKYGELVRKLISENKINACHDISDGGMLVALFEMCSKKLGIKLDLRALQNAAPDLDINHLLFGEDQARYILAAEASDLAAISKITKKEQIPLLQIGIVIGEEMNIDGASKKISELQKLNEAVFANKFGI